MNLSAVGIWWNTTAPVGRFRGHPVLVRWTLPLYFLLGLGHYTAASRDASGELGAPIAALPLILSFSLIAVIVMHVAIHEFAHIAAAKRLGLPTGGIVLDPLHGLRPYGRPRQPSEEFVAASAGVVATALTQLFTAVPYGLGLSGAIQLGDVGLQLLEQSFAVGNVILAVNLLPLFPYDGGSLFRSIMAPRVGARRATEISAATTLVVAIAIAIAAVPVALVFGVVLLPVLWLVAATAFLAGLKARDLTESEGIYASELSYPDPELDRPRVLARPESDGESWKSTEFDPSASFAESLEQSLAEFEDDAEETTAEPGERAKKPGPIGRYFDARRQRREVEAAERDAVVLDLADDLLVKIRQVGMDGLDRAERRILEDASQILRARAECAEQVDAHD